MVLPKPVVLVWFSHVGFFSLGLNRLALKKVWFSLVPPKTSLGVVRYGSNGSSFK
jgi:hypothetical protein